MPQDSGNVADPAWKLFGTAMIGFSLFVGCRLFRAKQGRWLSPRGYMAKVITAAAALCAAGVSILGFAFSQWHVESVALEARRSQPRR